MWSMWRAAVSLIRDLKKRKREWTGTTLEVFDMCNHGSITDLIFI
jgi:hypothetical protein